MITTLLTMLAAGGLVALVKQSWPWKTVEADEAAIKTRLGKVLCDSEGNPRIYAQGVVLIVPGFHKLRRCRIWQQSIRWEEQPIRLKDNLVFRVGVGLFFRIADPFAALFKIECLGDALNVTCHAELRGLLADLDHTQVTDPRDIADRLGGVLRPTFAGWGVTEFEIKFHVFDPEGATSDLLLAEAMVAKVDALCAVKGWSRPAALSAHGANVMLAEGFPGAIAALAPAASNGNGNGHSNGHH